MGEVKEEDYKVKKEEVKEWMRQELRKWDNLEQ